MKNLEPGTLNLEASPDTPMTGTYVRVILVQAAILLALWLFGRFFA